MFSLFGFFSPGPIEIVVIAAVILLLFGNRLPSVMRSMGRGIVEFKKGVKGIEDDVDEAGKLEDAGEIRGKVEREAFKKYRHGRPTPPVCPRQIGPVVVLLGGREFAPGQCTTIPGDRILIEVMKWIRCLLFFLRGRWRC